ncbi:MAG: Uma2 family endonuclease [SAR202 cluster bacterium]|nr:Uma2 family endonuclease [SAR202 cluster bacterium]
MLNPNVKFTVQDYMNLPESEDKRYELIEGELYMVPAPKFAHQIISKKLFRVIDEFVERGKLGVVAYAPVDVVLSVEDVMQPDIIYVSSDRESIITEDNVQGAPDLVIEILSPGTAGRDRTIKRGKYARFGVREYWIVDPQKRTLEVTTAGKKGLETVRIYPEGTKAESPLLPGLEVDLSAVFP